MTPRKLYYLQESTGENTRRHPRDEEFRQLVFTAKIEMMHAPASGDLSYLMYDTSLIRAMEESLFCAAKQPVSAALQKLQSGQGTQAIVRYTFDVQLDNGRWCKCFTALPYKERSETGFRVLLEAEESREYKARPSRPVCRRTPATDAPPPLPPPTHGPGNSRTATSRCAM